MPRIPTYNSQASNSPVSGGLGVRMPQINVPNLRSRSLASNPRQIPLDLAQAPTPMVNPGAMTMGLQAEQNTWAYLSKAFDTVASVGQMVGKAQEQAYANQQTALFNRATANTTKALNSWMIEYAERQDYQAFDGDYRQRVEELREQATEGLDGAYKEKFLAQFDIDAIQTYAKLRGRVRKMATDDAISSSEQMEQVYKEQMILDPSPAARDRVMDRHAVDQDQLARLGLITKTQAVQNKQAFAAERAEIEIREAIQGNPEVLEAAIEKPQNHPELAHRLSLLPPAKRQSLANEARSEYRQRLAEVDRVEARQDRLRKQAQEAKAAEMFGLAVEGNLKLPQVEAALANREIGTSDYRLLRQRALEDHTPDPTLKRNTLTSILANEWEGGLKGLAALPLPAKDVAELQGKLTQTQKAGDVSSTPAYKLSRDNIRRSIVTSGPGSAILNPGEQDKLSDAYREFDERVRQGKEPIKTIEDDIRSRYGTAPTIDRFPKPRFGTKPELTSTSKPEFDAAMAEAYQRTKAALEAGQISQQDYQREIINIKRMRDAAARRFAMQTTKTGKR